MNRSAHPKDTIAAGLRRGLDGFATFDPDTNAETVANYRTVAEQLTGAAQRLEQLERFDLPDLDPVALRRARRASRETAQKAARAARALEAFQDALVDVDDRWRMLLAELERDDR